MQADFSVELGGDAPALEIPWRSDDPDVRYYDLKSHPELVHQIPEAIAYPELGSFLLRINAAGFPLATAKCDVWSSSEVAPEEEIFGDRKFVSYIDLIFVDEKDRCSFEKHEAFAKELCRLLDHAPEIAATVELVIRHCYYHQENIVSQNEPEQGDTLPKTVKDSGMNPPGSEDTIGHSGQADVAGCGKYADIAHQGESAKVRNHMHVGVIQDEPAIVSDQGEHVSATHDEEPSNNEEPSKVTDHNDEQIRVPNHGELAILSEGQQSSAQESERADLLHCGDSFKEEPSEKSHTAPLGKSGNVELERKQLCEEPNASVTGFCLTAYVTGFGDSDHDPVRRWTIGLNLLQHALVQLSSKTN